MDTDLSAADASFIGEDAEDRSGISVSGAGDVNGDGYDDFLIGAYGDEDGGSDAGQTYLILGKSSGWAMDTDLSAADASFIGEDSHDLSGCAVSGAGDVNGDGYDDFLIGAYGDEDGGSDAGQTYLILGKSSGWAMDTDLSAADASFWGEYSHDLSGSAVSGAGDVNGDGYDDFLIGAYYDEDGGSGAGQTYLLLSSVDIAGSSAAISDNTWHHVVGTYDGSNVKIYVDGVLKATDARTDDIVSTTADLNIGIFRDCVNKEFKGKIDEVRIWNDERTEAEIRSNMYKELAGTETGLTAYYKFNETSGTTADNAEGTASLDGTLTNMTNDDWVTSSAFAGPKNCLDFDGIDDYVEVPDHTSLNITTNLTLEVWVKLEDSNDNQKVMGKYTSSNGYMLGVAGTKLYPEIRSSTGTNYTFQSGIILSGEWTHLAVTWTSGGQMVGYVNGVQVKSISASSNPIGTTGNSLIIGAAPWNPSAFSINGYVDEARIWNVARTATQIRENMCKTLVGNETGLQAYYRFDQYDASGQTTLCDITSNNNHGTLNNMDATTDWDDSEAFNTWFGSEGTSWATASNWSDGLPTSSDNVGIVNYGGSQPTLTGSPIVNNMVIGSSAILTLSSGATVNGNLILEENLDLNGQTVTLGSSATLVEGTGLLSGNSGTITTTRTLSNIDEDVAGLGAEITTSSNMGNTTVTRGHAAQTGAGNTGILRYYDITPINNSGLDATLVFHYDDSELNGKTESSLQLWKSTDEGSTWSNEGGAVNTTDNTITLSNIGSFSYWTATDPDNSLPVTLASFTATADDGQVTLRWITESEIENLGFNIYRSANSNVKFLMINDELIPGTGNSSSRHEYEYVDKGLTNGATYWYKLEDVDYSGNTELHGTVSATPIESAFPAEFRLYPNYPNPFNSITTISYDLPDDGFVDLSVYNMRGEKVATLMQGNQEAGSYRLNWDGTSQSGDIVASGIYFLRIANGSYSRTSKMVFIR